MPYGTIVNVSSVPVAEELTTDVASGATVLPVVDISTFDSLGGYVRVRDVVYPYSSIDETASTVTLTSPTVAALPAGVLVFVYPEATEKTALVSLGDEGDAIDVTVPHALAPLLSDGFRDQGYGENVLVTERGVGEFVLTDIAATPAVVQGENLSLGEVDPDRLSVGVVTNLVQDPNLLGPSWPPLPDWTIGYEETGAHAGSGFLRSVSRGTREPAPPYQDATDSTYFLTPKVDVEEGRAVRVSAQVRRDVAALATALDPVTARVRVVFYKADVLVGSTVTPGAVVSDSSTSTELSLVDDTVAGEWVSLTGAFPVPAGCVAFRAAVQVDNQIDGAVDFIKPEVQVVWNRMQSANYVEGSTGMLLDENTAQLQNLNIVEELGADAGSFRSLTVNGVDVETGLVAPLSAGLVAYDISTSGTNTANIGSTETKLYEFGAGQMDEGRLYRITAQGHVQASAQNVAVDIRIRATLDGSAPTTTSQVYRTVRIQCGVNLSTYFEFSKIFTPGIGGGPLRVALTMEVAAGTGTAFIYGAGSDRALSMNVEDVGLYYAATVAGSLSQKSVASGVVQADPVATYRRTWWGTWAGSYKSANDGYGERPDGTSDLYQGVSSTRIFGNQRSLFGLDYANIQAALSGATVKAISITFRMKAAAGRDGITLYLNSHNYTSKPGSFNPANVNNDVAHWGNRKEGSTYTHALPLSVGNSLKSGSIRGFGFGPAPGTSFDAYYGYCYGAGTSRPRITITYTK